MTQTVRANLIGRAVQVATIGLLTLVVRWWVAQ